MREDAGRRKPTGDFRVNHEIRSLKVRLIGKDGKQIGVVPIREAMAMAEADELDLVEVVPDADPPVCKVINYGKFRYDQVKKEKENKKSQHQIKVKEVKLKPNIDDHDFAVKLRHAREFVEKGNKVKITCMFRGRELAHPEVGERVVQKFCQDLADLAGVESPAKRMGRTISVVLAPGMAQKRKEEPRDVKPSLEGEG